MWELKHDILWQLNAISRTAFKAEALYSFLYGKDEALKKYLYTILEENTAKPTEKASIKKRRNKYSYAFSRMVGGKSPEPKSCTTLFEAVKSKMEAILNEEYSEDDEQNAVYLLRLLKINGLKAALQTKNPYERTIRAVEEFLDDEVEDDEED